MNFDVLLCCAPKDFTALPFALSRLRRFVSGIDGIYCVSPVRPPLKELEWIPDERALACDRSRWRFRPNWIFQQFVKLFQEFTPNRFYLAFDADVMTLRPISFFSETGTPRFLIGRNQFHKPYFRFQEKVLGLPRQTEFSFINDLMLFDREIISAFLERVNDTRASFIEKSYRLITKKRYLSEQELYGNFCERYFPGRYEKKKSETMMLGRSTFDSTTPAWPADDIERELEIHSTDNADFLMFHSWQQDPKRERWDFSRLFGKRK